MPAYPSEKFALLEYEKAEIETLSKLITEKATELGHRHVYSLLNLERGNATLAAWESWCGNEGYGTRQHDELDMLSQRLRDTTRHIRERARRILSKRIRKPCK